MEPFYLCNTELFGLSNSTAVVYSFLCKVNNVSTGKSNYKRSNIAKACHISVSTVIRALRTLCAKGLLEIKQNFDSNGRQTSNHYILIENPQIKLFEDRPSTQKPDDMKIESHIQDCPRLFPCRLDLFKHSLTASDVKVYSYLSLRAGKSGTCMPSKKEIAADCGISVSSVGRALKALSNFELLKIRPQTRTEAFGNNGTSVNLYLLKSPHTEAQEQSEVVVHEFSNLGKQAAQEIPAATIPTCRNAESSLCDHSIQDTAFLRTDDTLPHFSSDTPRTRSRKKATVNLREKSLFSILAVQLRNFASKIAGFGNFNAKAG